DAGGVAADRLPRLARLPPGAEPGGRLGRTGPEQDPPAPRPRGPAVPRQTAERPPGPPAGGGGPRPAPRSPAPAAWQPAPKRRSTVSWANWRHGGWRS